MGNAGKFVRRKVEKGVRITGVTSPEPAKPSFPPAGRAPGGQPLAETFVDKLRLVHHSNGALVCTRCPTLWAADRPERKQRRHRVWCFPFVTPATIFWVEFPHPPRATHAKFRHPPWGRRCPRPRRVRFFECHRTPRVRSASGPRPRRFPLGEPAAGASRMRPTRCI
eukprot:gene15391-biopygen11228